MASRAGGGGSHFSLRWFSFPSSRLTAMRAMCRGVVDMHAAVRASAREDAPETARRRRVRRPAEQCHKQDHMMIVLSIMTTTKK